MGPRDVGREAAHLEGLRREQLGEGRGVVPRTQGQRAPDRAIGFAAVTHGHDVGHVLDDVGQVPAERERACEGLELVAGDGGRGIEEDDASILPLQFDGQLPALHGIQERPRIGGRTTQSRSLELADAPAIGGPARVRESLRFDGGAFLFGVEGASRTTDRGREDHEREQRSNRGHWDLREGWAEDARLFREEASPRTHARDRPHPHRRRARPAPRPKSSIPRLDSRIPGDVRNGDMPIDALP
jgi:hypothetical protein